MIELKHRYEDIDPAMAARMQTMRREFQDAFYQSEENHLEKHGINQYTTRTGGSNTISSGRQDRSNDYILKRLHRDNKPLYTKVIHGEMSATKAAEKAGFKTTSEFGE